MSKIILNGLKYLAFLALGIAIFIYAYRDYDFKNFTEELKELKFGWLGLSFLFSIFSNLSRALRWNMLLKSLGNKTRIINSFIAVHIMYLVNMLIPRGGEVARCTVITKYQKTPISKVIGTVVIERTTDVVALLFVFLLVIVIFFSTFIEFFQENFSEFKLADVLLNKWLIIAGASIIGVLILVVLFWKRIKQLGFYSKIIDFLLNIWKGILTVKEMEGKWIYIGHTVFIYLMWLLQLYFVFLAFKPTQDLYFSAALFTLIMGTLAMFVPVNAGIGPYHFMVIQSLLIFGIAEKDGATFALIVHGFTNISLAILAIIFSTFLPMLNRMNQDTEDDFLPENSEIDLLSNDAGTL